MDAATLTSDGHGLVAIYVRPPGSPDLAQHLCSDGADWSLRCRTVAGDGIVAELERSRGKRWNLLLTTPTAPAAVPRGAFYFVSLTNPLEVLAASPRTFTANPQCTALLPPGEMASLKACTLLWHELSLRCNWVGDLRDARSHRELVTELVARGGGVWRHARPAMPPFELTPFEPEPLRFTSTAQELEPLRARHAGDYALYRWARKQHATCTRGGHYVRGDDDTPPYTQIGRFTFEQVSHTARFGYRHRNASTNLSAPMWTSWKNYSWVSDDCPSLHAPHDWCATLRGLRIVFVGDSTQYQAFLSLLGLLHAAEWASVGKDFQLDWKKSRPVTLCNDANTTLFFVRNDWLVDPTWRMGCSYAEMGGNPSTICRYWAQTLHDADVIVGTTGAHVIFPEGRHLNHTYMLARELNRTKALLVWRNAYPGHEGCCRADLSPSTEPLTKPYAPNARNSHNWASIGPHDDAVFDIFESVMPRRVMYLDDAHFTNARADRHVCGNKNDCLHHFLPGPPDVSNLVLRQMLSEVRAGISGSGI